jgi:hypothetical protein
LVPGVLYRQSVSTTTEVNVNKKAENILNIARELIRAENRQIRNGSRARKKADEANMLARRLRHDGWNMSDQDILNIARAASAMDDAARRAEVRAVNARREVERLGANLEVALAPPAPVPTDDNVNGPSATVLDVLRNGDGFGSYIPDRRGYYIAAIKRLREETGLNLREAKDRMDAWFATGLLAT